MRFGVISDIHANMVALEAVLEDMGPVDQYWCLGDVVGYGPQPNECIESLRELDHVVVIGNHDAAVIGKVSTRDFNGEARQAVQWTTRELDKEGMEYLKAMPEQLEHDEVLLVHGSPRDPIWEYILEKEQAEASFAITTASYILVGHTHVPSVFVQDGQGQVYAGVPRDKMALRLGTERMLINPGSVGQPRDGDPRAAYAIVDSSEMRIEFHRVEYDITEAQRRMRSTRASEWLISRLAYGR